MNQKTRNTELVFGLVYPIGTDADPVIDVLKDYLAQISYSVHEFRVSSFLQTLDVGIKYDPTDPSSKMKALIEAGNEARKRTSADILARAALNDILDQRPSPKRKSDLRLPIDSRAYLIRSFKRKEEVKLFRDVYRPGFFLIGIAADDDEQIEFLVNRKGLTEEQARDLMERDQNEKITWGQRTRETFYLADVFVELKDDNYKKQLRRFLDLVFGDPFNTPVREEHAMFMAYSSSARSAQQGRQVGAAITTSEGEVVAVGFNEVPSSAGGPYWQDDDPDFRDHQKQEDSNVTQKNQIAAKIVDGLEEHLLTRETIATVVRKALSRNTERYSKRRLASVLKGMRGKTITKAEAIVKVLSSPLGDITEYGRAVHAEMDALLTCARLGIPVKGKLLFTTTFPCHNCTRHIIASGISKVVYIEPYPKSKAENLHSDAICFCEEDASEPRRIPFVPFVGVGPRRYLDLFSVELSAGRKIERQRQDGQPIKWDRLSHEGPRVSMVALQYLEREYRAVDTALQQLSELQGRKVVKNGRRPTKK